MYKQFFGLEKEPFTMTVDPSFLFLTGAHREALAGLTYAVLNRKGFVVLTGEAGTGKTTLLSRTLQSVPAPRAVFNVISNPTLTPAEFMELALIGFGITEVPASKAQRLIRLQYFLMGVHSVGKAAVLVIDEAQRLPPDVLEEVRLLSNFELPGEKLLQIILAGQSELADVLNRNDLRQLKQRIAVRLAIRPLANGEVGQYIQYRWNKAGAKQLAPFRPPAVNEIIRWSRGIPRLINAICDNALVLAYGKGIASVERDHVLEVARDLQLLNSPGFSADSSQVQTPEPVQQIRPMPKSAPLAEDGHSDGPISLPSLDRYIATDAKRSWLSRYFGRPATAKKPGMAQ